MAEYVPLTDENINNLPTNLKMLFWHLHKKGRMILQCQQLFNTATNEPTGQFVYNTQLPILVCAN